MTIYGFRNQNYSKTGGYGQPYPYNGTQNESVNQWNYQPNNYLMQHNELPSRRTQETIIYFQPSFQEFDSSRTCSGHLCISFAAYHFFPLAMFFNTLGCIETNP